MKAALVIIAIFAGIMFAIAVVSNAPTLLGFARGLSSAIVLSADGGETWFALGKTEENQSFINSNILTLSFNPSDARILYAGTEGNGLFKSIDGGANWYKINDSNNVLSSNASVYDVVYGNTSISVEDGISETIYIAAYQSGYGRIFRSLDGGFTFKEIYITALEAAGIYFVFADRGGTQNLWASTGEGILVYSNDFGETWQRKEQFSHTVPTKMLRSGSSLLIVTADRGLYISRDNGETWSSHSDALKEFRNADEILDIAQDKINPQNLHLATSYGLLSSSDFGRTWQTVDITIPENELPIRRVSLSPMARNTLFVAAGRNMYISINGGQTWKVRHLLVRGVVNAIAPHPTDPSYVLAGTFR